MKVLVARFATESNANIPVKNTILDYSLAINSDQMIEKMQVKNLFDEADIELIPSIYAYAGPSGVLERNCFDYIESCILNQIRNHLDELDGILLFLHGASYVDTLGSGEHHLLKEIRKITGNYLPIAIACDPHGNLTQEYAESATIIRSYRESPHTDIDDTFALVAKMLIDLLKNRRNVTPVYKKLPLILGGEQSVSADEPVRTINKFMDEMEKDERLLSVSWHVGYIRHDCPEAGCGVIVIPQDNQYRAFAEEKAEELAEFIWKRRHEFHYTGTTAEPDEALHMAIHNPHGISFITDSGDNTTSGATGWNTFILRQALQIETDKKFLFAAINDPKTAHFLAKKQIGETVSVSLGVNHDEMSKSVDLKVKIKQKGKVMQPFRYNGEECFPIGDCVTVSVLGHPIDIIITDKRQAYTLKSQFDAANVNWDDYDVIVVKIGYIFPELKKKAGFYVMSLTNGPTLQDTRRINFKRIMRPMYPIDNI
ncbi:MAG: M81 family metallopeptidase [Erysipelotrichaceae bacterium]|nr:M81 family metallopeptidase [Erysipelotrichaceae bacterium]